MARQRAPDRHDLGPEDLSAELGAEVNRDAVAASVALSAGASHCASSAPRPRGSRQSTPSSVEFRNIDAVRRDTEEARRDGFTGKMAIHPAQVPVINEVFTPTPPPRSPRPRP